MTQIFIKKLRNKSALILTNLRRDFLYDTVKNPHQLMWVNPAAIKLRLLPSEYTDKDIFAKMKKETLHLYDLERGAFNTRQNAGRLLEGDWDLKTKPYDVEILCESYHQRFNEGADWEETPCYAQGVGILKHGGILYGCRTLEEFKNIRLSYIDKLYNNIKTYGYLTQSKTAGHDNRSKDIYHEISVNIGRNGEIIYNNCTGNNRLALAKAMKLEKVPVLVVVRHKKWELLKKQLKNTRPFGDDMKLKAKVKSHPDLQIA